MIYTKIHLLLVWFLSLTYVSYGEHLTDIKYRTVTPRRIKTRGSTSTARKEESNEGNLFPRRIPIQAKVLYDGGKCSKDYILEDDAAYLIYSSPDPDKYECIQNFRTLIKSSDLQLSCFSCKFRFNCDYESLEVSTESLEDSTENINMKICGETEMPTVTGQKIRVKYSRHLFGLHGSYTCVIVARGISEHTSSPSKAAFKECSNCGMSTVDGGSRSVLINNKSIAAGRTQTRVVGGKTAIEKEYPWMVYLQITVSRDEIYACGGALVNKGLIVTAAHCLEGKISGIKVALGKNDLNNSDESGSEWIDTMNYTVHPDYDKYEITNDIALIKLPAQVQFSDQIKPLCLPTEDLNDLEGVDVTATGWGLTKFNGKAASKLQTVVLRVWTQSKCYDTWGGLDQTIIKSQICALESGKDTCNGDSGGPLATNINNRWIMVGLTSYGYECAKGIPGVYTRISKFSKWISDHVDKNDCD